MKRFALPICIVAVLGAFLFWWFSPVQVVKRRTETLLQVLTMESGSGKAGRQAGVYSLNALLAAEVELSTPDIPEANGTFERQEMESAFSWLGEQAKQTRFDLEKIKSVQIAGDLADVTFSLDSLVELPTSRPADGHYEVTFQWRREDNNWRLASARWTKTGP